MTPSEKRYVAERLRDVLPEGWRVRLAVRRNTLWCNVIQGTAPIEKVSKLEPSADGTVMVNRYWLEAYIHEPYVRLFEDMVTELINSLVDLDLADMLIRVRLGTATTKYREEEK